MSDQIKELADIPRDFLRDGTLFLNRCTKRGDSLFLWCRMLWLRSLTSDQADKREFIKISQAVGVGFVIMGTIGYFVKLSASPAKEKGRGLLTDVLLLRSTYPGQQYSGGWSISGAGGPRWHDGRGCSLAWNAVHYPLAV